MVQIEILSKIKTGQKGKIKSINSSLEETIILAEHGFLPDVPIKISRNDMKGPLIINCRGIKAMVSRKLCNQILIETD